MGCIQGNVGLTCPPKHSVNSMIGHIQTIYSLKINRKIAVKNIWRSCVSNLRPRHINLACLTNSLRWSIRRKELLLATEKIKYQHFFCLFFLFYIHRGKLKTWENMNAYCVAQKLRLHNIQRDSIEKRSKQTRCKHSIQERNFSLSRSLSFFHFANTVNSFSLLKKKNQKESKITQHFYCLKHKMMKRKS